MQPSPLNGPPPAGPTTLPRELEEWEANWHRHTLPFLRALSGSDEPEQHAFTWQIIDDAKLRFVRPHHVHLPLSRARVEWISAQRQGGGIFVTVNETDGAGRNLANIQRVRAVWAEIDHELGTHLYPDLGWIAFWGTPAWRGQDRAKHPAVDTGAWGAPVRIPLRPSIVVKTRKGYHLYWLTEDVTGEQAHELLWWVHHHLHGDPETLDLARVLRVPGTFHLKNPNAPHLIELVHADHQLTYTHAQLSAAFPPLPGKERPPPPVSASAGPAGELAADEVAWATSTVRGYLAQRAPALEGQAGDGHTYETVARVQDYLPDEVIAMPLLLEWNARCLPPWSPEELKAKWDHAAKYRKSAAGSEVVVQRTAQGLFEAVTGAFPVAPTPPTAPSFELPPPPAFVSAPAAPAPAGAQVLSFPGVVLPGVAFAGVTPPVAAPAPSTGPALLRGGTTAHFLLDGNNRPQKVAFNGSVVLQSTPEWAGVFRFNLFNKQIDITRACPWEPYECEPIPYVGPVRSDDIRRLGMWLNRRHGLALGKDAITDAIRITAQTNPFHPIVDYLAQAEAAWLADGSQPRVDTWLVDFMGAEAVDKEAVRRPEFLRLAGRFWLTSACARVASHRGGSHVDTMLIFEGHQGLTKSSALRTLAVRSEWFSDARLDLHKETDANQKILGTWIQELAELDDLNRAESSAINAFITKRDAFFRAPYDVVPERHWRQSVFAGTSNKHHYLKDETGGRRFWPVHCTRIDLEGLARMRDMLWGEAFHLFKAGARWHPVGDEVGAFQQEQAKRFQGHHPWHDVLAGWASQDGQQYVSLPHLLEHVLGITKDKWKGNERAILNKIMHQLRWDQCDLPLPENAAPEAVPIRGWARPAPPIAQPSLPLR